MCTCGTCSYSSMTLVINYKVSAQSFLHLLCTCGTLLHPTCSSGTCSYSSMTLVIHRKSLPWSFLHPTCTAGPFSIRPVGPDGLHVTCTYETFLYLHPACGTWWLAYHVYLWDLSPSPSDLWDLTACMSCVPMGPFSISIQPVGPDGLSVTYGPFSIRPWKSYVWC
jgi:hypothetical protein